MAEAVYILCAATSIGCAVLLARRYRRTHSRLLLWSSLCFAGLALNNLLVIVDLLVVPEVDMTTLRSSVALGGLLLLVFGLVWDAR